jgi:ribosomal protein L30E
MKNHFRANWAATFAAATVLSILTAGALSSPVFAGYVGNQHEHHAEGERHSSNEAGAHGGHVTMTKEFHFEVAFDRKSTRVYLYDSKQNPISAKDVTGTVNISFPDQSRKPLDVKLSYAEPMKEHGNSHASSHQTGHGFLQANVSLEKVQEGDMKAVFVLENLPGESEKEITFEETFKLARIVAYECPMSCVSPADNPGDCPKCGMALKRTETIYACSMHANVTSQNADDKCWACGMKVTKVKEGIKEVSGHEGHKH